MSLAKAFTYYHNPACSKSCAGLKLLQQRINNFDEQVDLVEYLNSPPSAATVRKLAEGLGLQEDYSSIIREEVADKQNIDHIVSMIVEQPKLLQRPILVNNLTGKAAIGRPLENFEGLF
ncbi:arsenate reductase [Basidiobolus meristosporus CBS 931.73]|uniref:Arsenate reductase n=1 Tax=Basidiobolus meristosporus CBS 931.73 TaxID=1314790 RepID=A0A1Y1XYH2_9FUNG|nr:arsenate reductase [Basidiobolus meristosporus CBS 931.73]|eukprot:ORX90791.1 arsenate reductase [Basidiobolus meristosporus CBS 931.73]